MTNSPLENADRTGFMCTIDWQHELGEACGGSKVYSSVEDLKENHTCWEECGITEVRVVHVRDVVPQNLFGEKNDDAK